jgi:hypothetical protein
MAKKKTGVDKAIQDLVDETIIPIRAGSLTISAEDIAKLPPEVREWIDQLVTKGLAMKFQQPMVVLEMDEVKELLPDYKPPTEN